VVVALAAAEVVVVASAISIRRKCSNA